ncbi:MAG: ribosome silencing factor [Candidatus Kapaibacteriota bacterium]
MVNKIMFSKALAKWVALVAEEKLGKEILIVDLTSIESAPADFFVICSCDSDVQMRAIVDEIEIRCKKEHLPKPKVEGINSSYWVLLDFFDVVFHIFHHHARKFYNLERLWSDGSFYKLSQSGRLVPVRDKTKLLTEFEQNGV